MSTMMTQTTTISKPSYSLPAQKAHSRRDIGIGIGNRSKFVGSEMVGVFLTVNVFVNVQVSTVDNPLRCYWAQKWICSFAVEFFISYQLIALTTYHIIISHPKRDEIMSFNWFKWSGWLSLSMPFAYYLPCHAMPCLASVCTFIELSVDTRATFQNLRFFLFLKKIAPEYINEYYLLF